MNKWGNTIFSRTPISILESKFDDIIAILNLVVSCKPNCLSANTNFHLIKELIGGEKA